MFVAIVSPEINVRKTFHRNIKPREKALIQNLGTGQHWSLSKVKKYFFELFLKIDHSDSISIHLNASSLTSSVSKRI